MSKFLLLTAPKVKGQTKQLVRAAAGKAQPGYRVASVKDVGTEWEVRLEKLTDKVSSSKRQAAPPPEFLKEKSDSDAPADDSKSDSDEAPKSDDSDDSDSDSDSEDSKDEGEKKDKVDGDPSTKDDPVSAIKSIMDQLNNLLGELGGHAEKLKEKADKVDEVHELTKGDGDMVDDMGEVPPVPPIDDAAAIGPTPGGEAPPVPPRRPPVPSGKAKRSPKAPPVGVPTFTKKKTKIVEHPIKDDDGEYTIADFFAAVASDPQCEGYTLTEVKTVKEANVYAGKLELAE